MTARRAWVAIALLLVGAATAWAVMTRQDRLACRDAHTDRIISDDRNFESPTAALAARVPDAGRWKRTDRADLDVEFRSPDRRIEVLVQFPADTFSGPGWDITTVTACPGAELSLPAP